MPIPIILSGEIVDCCLAVKSFFGLPPQIALALKLKIDPELVHIKVKRKKGLM
jgi:hypothetical protein